MGLTMIGLLAGCSVEQIVDMQRQWVLSLSPPKLTKTYPQISEQVKVKHLSRAETSANGCPRKQGMEGIAEMWSGQSKSFKDLRSGLPGHLVLS